MLQANYSPEQLETALIEYANECAKLGIVFVKCKARYEELDDGKKIKFALLVDEVKEDSNTAKEKAATRSASWRKYIRALTDARFDYLSAQMAYDTATRNFDTCRSLLSSKNTERRTCT